MCAAGVLSFVIAVIVGFIPGKTCGSYLAPLPNYPSSIPDFNGETTTWKTVHFSCDVNGHPTMFWIFIWLGIALFVAGIIVHQVAAHRADKSPNPPKPIRASVYVSATNAQIASDDGNTSPLVDQITKLNELHQSGALSAEEFTIAKARLLGDGS